MVVAILVLTSCSARLTSPMGTAANESGQQFDRVPLSPERLRSRPHDSVPRAGGRGLRRLPLRGGEALLFVPRDYRRRRPAPLALELHGAGGSARGGLGPFLNAGPDGVILLSVKSQGRTWDLIEGDFGPDARFIDRALGYVFAHYAIDRRHVAALGFSDGASYALSLGISNGDVFTHLIALSPGFIEARSARGHPRIFIGHGADDDVLPIERTSARLLPRLRSAGYDVTFRRHSGGHSPRPLADAALRWFLRG
jgi:phospholipase/carboxylesterase